MKSLICFGCGDSLLQIHIKILLGIAPERIYLDVVNIKNIYFKNDGIHTWD